MAESGVNEEDVSRLSTVMADMKMKADEISELNRQLYSVDELRTFHRCLKNQGDADGMIVNSIIMAKFMPNEFQVSTTPLAAMKRLTMKDLQVESNVQGGFIIVRVIEPGNEPYGWSSLIEDERGHVCFLEVFNYPPRELFCVGTILIIKEPCFTREHLAFPSIRCDCPTNIIVVTRSHKLYEMVEKVKWVNPLGDIEPHEVAVLHGPLTASADEWKERGNRLFRDGHWSLAHEAYQLGLQRCLGASDPTRRVILSNMTAVYLYLGYYEKTVATFELIPDDRTALFRAGRAHYQLRHYEEALKAFSNFHSKYPEVKKGRQEVLRAKIRVDEQTDGYPSLTGLAAERRRSRLNKLDHADYIGPVKVVPSVSGKGRRGVVLTRGVKKGEILIVSKAFSATLEDGKPEDYLLNSTHTIDPNGHSLEMVFEISVAIARNPRTFGPMIYGLPQSVHPEQPIPIFCSSESRDEPISDLKAIMAVCAYNSFYICSEDDGTIGAGLFVFPSYINHSCKPNVECVFYNDVMVVRSTKRLRAGAEVLMSCVPEACSDRTLRYLLLQQRGITCNCRLCQPLSI